MKEHEINNLNNFIAGYYCESFELNVLDDIVNYHIDSNNKNEGSMYSKNGGYVDKNVKESIDVILRNNEIIKKYCNILQKCADLYMLRYPKCNEGNPWNVIEPINIQQYPKGGGFKIWHSERMSNEMPFCFRHLVFMTYLNDVLVDGETEFYHQKLKIKPEKGLTLIWPADWTFTHRGIPSNSEEKIITTGWFSYTS